MIVRTAEKIAEIWEDVILLRTFAYMTSEDGLGCENTRLYITRKINGGAHTSPTRYIYLYGEQDHLRLIIGAANSEGALCFRPSDMIDVFEMMDEGDLVEVV